jgi:hypothetical protein
VPRVKAWSHPVFLALLLCGTAGYGADKQELNARALFERAEKAYNGGRFEEALGLYSQAYDQKPLPGFLFNLGQCHKNLGQLERAEFFFTRYLDLTPAAKQDPRAQVLLAQVKAKRAEEKSATAEVPPPAILPTAPQPSSPEIVIQPEPSPVTRSGPTRWAFVTTGVAAASAVGGIVSLALAKQQSNRLTGGDGAGGMASSEVFTPEQANAVLREGQLQQSVGIGLLIGAGVVAVVSVVLFAVTGGDESVAISAGGLGGLATVRF